MEITEIRVSLKEGQDRKLHTRALISSRNPWYRMEKRVIPPILFAYLGRRHARFILNNSNAIPLTGFLCVYPWDNSNEYREKLWRALNHPKTIANLLFVGKSYGGGAIKVEPRQLDSLEIPTNVLAEVGLTPLVALTQPALFETPHHRTGEEEKVSRTRHGKR